MWIFIKQFYVRSTFPPFLGRDRESGDWTAWWGKPGKGPRGEWEAVSWWSWFINICSDVLSCSSAVLLAWTFHDHGCLVSRWGRRRHSVRSRRQLRLGSWAMGGGRRHGFWFLVSELEEFRTSPCTSNRVSRRAAPNPISFPLLILSPTHIQDSAETVLALGSTVRLKPEWRSSFS